MQIIFTPIGKTCSTITKRHDMPCKGTTAKIIIYKKYAAALDKIEQEKYLWILCYLHQANTRVLQAIPRKSKTLNKTQKGVFALRSPDRPNPIALTKVTLLKREGLTLYISGLDVIDKTPVLDIKSYKRPE